MADLIPDSAVTARDASPLEPHVLLQVMEPLTCVAAALLTRAGELVKANRGFMQLLEAAGNPEPRQLFIQPTYDELLSTLQEDGTGAIFAGLLTLGNDTSTSRSLFGTVRLHAEGEQLLVVGEHSVEELEQLAATVLQLNNELTGAQRQLVRQNRELQQRESRIEQLLRTDPLTDLGNRRLLDELLPLELERSMRTGAPLSMVMLDLDNFKNINDVHGHDIGDSVLRQVARLLTAALRPYDTIVRLGGEEFLLLLSSTDRDNAAATAERLRLIIAGETAPAVTASFGVAEYGPGDDRSTLLKRTDAALYRSKSAGRNRVSLG